MAVAGEARSSAGLSQQAAHCNQAPWAGRRLWSSATADLKGGKIGFSAGEHGQYLESCVHVSELEPAWRLAIPPLRSLTGPTPCGQEVLGQKDRAPT